jgi:hypothetical protein
VNCCHFRNLKVKIIKKSLKELTTMPFCKQSYPLSGQKQPKNYLLRSLVAGIVTSSSLLTQTWFSESALAATGYYCKFAQDAVTEKENLRQAYLKGNPDAGKSYSALIKKHGDILSKCRSQNWLKTQAIWLRLYPCDSKPGAMDSLFDDLVNRGYNQIYVEVFYDGQVLLPQSENSTPWASVVRSPGGENIDLLKQAIEKGRERGVKVYAWLFTMNFGYAYAIRPDRQDALAINGRGENSLTFVHDRSQAFIDPYNRQAQTDYYRLVEAVVKRRPDGILFDYIRYPRGSGTDSVAGNVKDLWLYGTASRQALYGRAQNKQGLALIKRYVENGQITASDLRSIQSLYPDESRPMWQGRNPSASNGLTQIQLDLWYLTVAHAAQGVIDFLNLAQTPAQRQGIQAGAVFFPDGNRPVGDVGFDSRLQPWDRFSPSLEWHPMSYALCGSPNCIVDEVRRVKSKASRQTKVIPALAGYWGRQVDQRPSLEAQMEAIRVNVPGVDSISHFAYSWQEPQLDRQRRFCEL